MRRTIERLETIGLGDRIWTAAITVTCSHADAGYGALLPRSLRWWVAVWNCAVRPPLRRPRDLRERVITAVETGASRREAAERFEVSVASAVKWLQRWYQQRSAAPKPRGGSVSPLEEFAVEILDLIAQRPDLTLVETVAELRKRRIKTSRSSLWRFLDRHNITLKKVLQAAERQRADVARARRRWIREQGMLDPARLVFIDETAVSTNMVRLRGRAPRGVRVIGAVPLGRWETITFVAALRHNKMVAPMVVEGAMMYGPAVRSKMALRDRRT